MDHAGRARSDFNYYRANSSWNGNLPGLTGQRVPRKFSIGDIDHRSVAFGEAKSHYTPGRGSENYQDEYGICGAKKNGSVQGMP